MSGWMQDDEAELLRELERIKKEREQDAAKKVCSVFGGNDC
jgi:hypothetical protein